MTAPSSRTARRPVSAVPGDPAADPGVIGIGLAAVLTFALAQGSWQWFATFIGVTFLAVMSVFERRARWSPGLRSPYPRAGGVRAGRPSVRAIALAPLPQRHDWPFPVRQARSDCQLLSR
ncbi:hypothetical protein [Streptomyces sp. NPDC058739]|uniref:hypothetical protein n=1 Tax=Streptomyces sp. NPDC058739 TaxID=3346618 RepID=UPI00368B0FA0